MAVHPRPWILIGARIEGDTAVLEYRDHAGRRLRAGEIVLPAPWLSALAPTVEQIRYPAGLGERVGELAGQYVKPRFGPHASGPIPLPIFVETPPELPAAAWEDQVAAVVYGAWLPGAPTIGAFQTAQLPRTKWLHREPFSLPLRIRAVGLPALEALQPVRNASWVDATVQAYGIRIDFVPETAGGNAAPADIVVADDAGIAGVVDGARARRRVEDRPRLILHLSDRELAADAADGLPAGVSLLWAHRPSWPPHEVVYRMLFGIVHDLPLHEVLADLLRSAPLMTPQPLPGAPRPVLFTDPHANHALRMADAYGSLLEDLRRLDKPENPTGLARLLRESERDDLLELAGEAEALEADWSTVRSAAAHARWTRPDFVQEARGLEPLAAAAGRLEQARGARRQAKDRLMALARNPAVTGLVAARQERRVDVGLEERFEENAMFAWGPLSERIPLRPGALYRVRVHIGHRSEDSLVEGDVPPLDPLLPDPEDRGWDIDVVVFEKRFALLSPRLQRIRLPRLGGSEPVYFEIEAPEQEGVADLRISIYHRNQLLQSFRLDAIVARAGTLPPDWPRPAVVRLDFSQTARFSNVDELGARALALAVNDDGDGTHTFMVKKDGVAARPIRLPEAVIAKHVRAFREILERYTESAGGGPLFESDAEPGAPRRPEFDTAIRELAKLGRSLFDALLVKEPELRPVLADLRETDGQTIQVTRHDANFVYPWPILYDYPLLPAIDGAPPRPVCMGRSLDPAVAAAAPAGAGCPHNPDCEVYCIEGFWGIRHRIEQLVGRGPQAGDAVRQVIRRGRKQSVRLADNIDDGATRRLREALSGALADAFSPLRVEENLFRILWSEERPAVLLIVGHLQTRDVANEPEGPRIVLVSRGQWLRPDPIPRDKWLQTTMLVQQAPEAELEWSQPKPLVLLMACQSGATEVSTLNNFMTTFHSIGAAAVVGTEANVFSGVAARFAREVTQALYGDAKMTLGEAIQAFNRRMLESGHPLPFVFSCVGNSDLVVEATEDR